MCSFRHQSNVSPSSAPHRAGHGYICYNPLFQDFSVSFLKLRKCPKAQIGRAASTSSTEHYFMNMVQMQIKNAVMTSPALQDRESFSHHKAAAHHIAEHHRDAFDNCFREVEPTGIGYEYVRTVQQHRHILHKTKNMDMRQQPTRNIFGCS